MLLALASLAGLLPALLPPKSNAASSGRFLQRASQRQSQPSGDALPADNAAATLVRSRPSSGALAENLTGIHSPSRAQPSFQTSFPPPWPPASLGESRIGGRHQKRESRVASLVSGIISSSVMLVRGKDIDGVGEVVDCLNRETVQRSPMEAFPHLRALFGGNPPPFSEWGTNPVILEADRQAREAASRPHRFSEFSTPHCNPEWSPPINLMHTQMSGEDGLLKLDFWLRYPTKPPHPERVSESDRFVRDLAKLRAQLACSYAVFLIRRHRQVNIDADAAQAAACVEAAAAETATYLASLAADDYLAAWLGLSVADVETLGITDMPPLTPASAPTSPHPRFSFWGDGTPSGLGLWHGDPASGWPTPPPDDTRGVLATVGVTVGAAPLLLRRLQGARDGGQDGAVRLKRR
ncbi:hypothetical protein B0H16DRAFT_1831135 [Mycena metata]|uniref:Uncharacterized protein n=1 Tax=Mycena metata TaxID=1033252 RepID=A0AAD7GN71_9AGAR|nr:hypothetical protein B0H16DRAFT_1831135 [Mycena metata]